MATNTPRSTFNGVNFFFLIFMLLSLGGYAQSVPEATYIKVKFNSDYINIVENAIIQHDANGILTTGIKELDSLARVFELNDMERVFPYNARYDQRHRKHGLHLWYQLSTASTGFSAESCAASFENCSFINIAESPLQKAFNDGFDVSNKVFLDVDDPSFSQQWHYENTGQTGGTADADIDLTSAWDVQAGQSDVIVAVIDGGIDVDHEDLADNMWVNEAELNGTAGVDDDENGYVDDIYGYGFGDGSGNINANSHGTHVGGTVGAVNNNDTGVSGVAGGTGAGDGVRLMSCATFGSSGTGGFDQAFIYAADNGAVISQNSWGYTSPGAYEQSVLDAIDYFIENAGYDEAGNANGPMQGGLVIFAAGNSNSSANYYPGYYEPVVAVASTDHNDVRSSFSNYGDWVDIAAPGSSVLSTFPGNTYGSISGTSMACPHVSGAAALIVSEFGGDGYSPDLVRARLEGIADDIDDSNPSYVGLLGSGRLNAYSSLLEDTGVAPDAIEDLATGAVSGVSAELTWTATGSNGSTGTASSYDLRFSTSTINEDNFSSATEVIGEPGPSGVGSTEEYLLENLDPITTYYVAIKATNLFGNTSEISNVLQFTTSDVAEITITPDSLVAILDAGESSTLNFTISNTGNETLEFNIPLLNQDNFSASGNETSYIDFSGWEPGKGEIDTRQGHPVLQGGGDDGENGFGYSWIDSEEANGPIFEWNDIRVDGQLASLSDDSFETVELPFEFEFYGEAKNEVYISSNGFLTFNSSGATRYSNAQIPSTSIPNDLIAMFWDDLYPRNQGTVHYLVENNQFTVQYTDIGYFGNSSAQLTFQVILQANGSIKLQYLDVADDRNGATIGIENATGEEGLQVAFNTSYLSDSLAIRISAVPDFITDITPTSGNLSAGEEVEISVIVDASGIEPGNYETSIGIESNDPVNSNLALPVLMHVNGSPGIEVSPDEINFETVFTNQTDSLLLSISNSGSDTLTVSDIIVSGDHFSYQSIDLPLYVMPGEDSDLTVFYNPGATGEHTGNLEIQSNVTSNPSVDVSLSGNSLNAPVVSLSASEISEALNSGDSSGVVLTIQNVGSSGAAVLDFDIGLSNSIDTEGVNTTQSYVKMQAPGSDHAFVERRLFVTLRENLSAQEQASIKDQFSVVTSKQFKYTKAELWDFADLTVEEALSQLFIDNRVLFAEPDYIVEAIDQIPDDARYEELWGLNNTGQTGGTNDADIDALEAWDISTSSSDLVVGIIDTGIDYNHEDLNDNIWINEDEVADNGVDDDGNGYIDDVYGWDFVNEDNDPMDGHSHGTHVAGTVGGEGDNGVGVVGVTWDVQLMALKFLSDFGSGTTSDAIEAIEYAIENGAHITNNSWGGGGFSQALRDVIEASNDANQLFVAAAGNSGQDADRFPHYPSSYDVENVISVAATDHNDQLASFSNYGLTSVDLAAPGVSILSSVPNDSYSSFSGTSMAAPHVAGALALAWGRDRLISNLELKEVLFESVDTVSAVQGRSVTGGRLNVLEMLGGLNGWLSIDVTDGSLSPDESIGINVSLNAAGLIGGIYTSNLVVTTNDPENSEIIIPVELDVTGVPNIALDRESLDFEAHFLGDTLVLSVEISSIGTDSLIVSEISIAHAEFDVDTTSLDLASGDAYDLTVRYVPETLGEITSTLVIRSNDTDQSELSIPVSGTGLEPPVIEVSPDSIGVALFTGETATSELTIDNSTGGSTLTWELTSDYERSSALGSQRTSIGFYAKANKEGVFGGDLPFISQGTNMPPSLTSSFSVLDTLDNFVENSTGVEVVGDTIYVLDWSNSQLEKYYLPDREVVETISIHSRPYGICYLDGNLYIGDNVGEIRIYSVAGDLIGNFDAPSSSYQSLTTNGEHLITTQAFTSGAAFYEVDVDGTIVNTFEAPSLSSYEMVWVGEGLWVLSNSHTLYRLSLNDLTFELEDTIQITNPGGSYSYSLGHSGDDLVFDSWHDQAYVIDDFQASFNWLSLPEQSGEVEAGSSTTVDINLDASGLNGGIYQAQLTIENNDPQNEFLTVPVAIEVSGAPDIDVSSETLDFGMQFVGDDIVETLRVTNDGTDSLAVTDLQLTNSDFSIDTTSFGLDPGESLIITVTYSPSSVANDDSELQITSNDADEGTITVQLLGEGVLPPVIEVTPDSIGVALLTGESETSELTINNSSGGSVLTWEITPSYRRLNALNSRQTNSNIGFYADHSDRGEAVETSLPNGFFESIDPPQISSTFNVLDTLDNFVRNSTGLEVVGDTIYVADWSSSQLQKYYIPDEEIVESIDIHSLPYGITYLNGNLYIGDSQGIVRIYSLSGELIGDFDGPSYSYYAITSYGENLLLKQAFSSTASFNEVDVSGEVLNTFEAPNVVTYEMVWERDDLWVLSASHILYHLALDDMTFQVTDTIVVENSSGSAYSIGHSGEDLVFDAWNTQAFVIDDLQESSNWLSLPILSGEVEAGSSATIDVDLDATGLNGGTYEAELTLENNDPDNELLLIPVAIEVTGAADIEVTPETMSFGTQFVGYDANETITITNEGTDILNVTDIQLTNSDFSVSTTSFSLDPGVSQDVTVTYNPSAEGSDNSELQISSNDVDESTLTVQLTGDGVMPPEISVNPDSIGVGLLSGEMSTQLLTIDNSSGGSDLEYEILIGPKVDVAVLDASPEFEGSEEHFVEKHLDEILDDQSYIYSVQEPTNPTLEISNVDDVFLTDFLDALEENSETLTSLIPGRYEFSGGETGFSISDGGGDMYDGGNYLTTETRLSIAYTNGVIQTATALNDGAYVTDKYPGLFVFAGDVSNVSYFEIYGNLGADGRGNVDGSVLSVSRGGREYLGFVKRVYNAGDPSVNHLVIVENSGDLAHTFSTNTNSDLHQVTGLENSEALYYLLYAGSNGTYINDDTTLDIMNAFIDVVEEAGNNFLSVSTTAGTIAAGSSTDIEVVFDATDLEVGLYEAALNIESNDPENDGLVVPVAMEVSILYPAIVVSPDSIGETLREGETSTRTITIDNSSGEAALNWAIDTNQGIGLTSTIYDTSNLGPSTVKKGEEPTIAGPIQPFGLGGPDSLGYSWVDSDQSGGPEFLWDEISSTGIDITGNMSDDNVSGPYPLGFDFEYYGNTYTEFYVSSNGFIRFGSNSSNGCCSGQPLPSEDGINNIIAWAWRDGYPFGNTFYENFDDRTVIEFENYGLCCSASNGSATAQVILYESGDIKINYLTLTGNYTNGNHSVGIENEDGTVGLQVAYNTDYLHDELSILFSDAPVWLTVLTESGQIPAGSSETVDLVFNASGLDVGMVELDLQVTSDDPQNELIEVPVTLEVLGSPDIDASPGSLDFGTIGATSSNTLDLYLENEGEEDLVISDFDFDEVNFNVSVDSLIIASNSSDTIQVTFNPQSVGTFSDTLTIVSNDPDESMFDVLLNATSFSVPEISVTDTLDFGSGFLNATVSADLHIINVGSEALDLYNISLSGNNFSIIEWTQSVVTIGDTAVVSLSFNPTEIGEFTGILDISSNDPEYGNFSVSLIGEGLDDSPQIIFNSDTISFPAGTEVKYHTNQFFIDPLGLDLSFSTTYEETVATYQIEGDTISVTGAAVGTEAFSVIATNSAGKQSVLNLVVDILNADPVTIGTIELITVEEGRSVTINLNQVFDDFNDPILNYSGSADEGVILAFSNNSLIVTGVTEGTGSITVIATDSYDSQASLQVDFEVVPFVLSVAESLDKMIYPNPSDGLLYIDQRAAQEVKSIEVIDFTGKKLDYKYDPNERLIDIKGVSEGVYFLRLTLTNNELLVKKFVISLR